jgi:hypothetical protein
MNHHGFCYNRALQVVYIHVNVFRGLCLDTRALSLLYPRVNLGLELNIRHAVLDLESVGKERIRINSV